MGYTEGFKQRMVERMTGPHAISPHKLASEVGVAKSTLHKWLNEASKAEQIDKIQEVEGHINADRPQDWQAEQKFQTVIEAASLSDDELGNFLRKKGIHEAQLHEWRKLMFNGLLEGTKTRNTKKNNSEAKRLKELEKDLHQKEKALAEASALLVLKKKANTIWGEGEPDTSKKKGKRF